ncbi:DUF3114 domain-containing protein [Streptococcus varani]|nr:DUF3114 domain-containing protein [Streptococcus varani]
MIIADKDFWIFWEESRKKLKKDKARQVLEELMEIAQMPDDLSGDLSENQYLVKRIAPDLPPHHVFWRDLSKLVNLAFPQNSLSQPGTLQRQVHQFRYVISSQQAQYIRRYYKKSHMTDGQALASYLKERRIFSYYLNEPSRFHNKVAISDGSLHYPGGKESYNIKVLSNQFHSEFILSSHGSFLNEVDAEVVTEEGIVNGASFNYGRFSRHWQLDVDPVGPHDPIFRKKMSKGFQSPKNSKKRFGCKLADDYERSYFNPTGLYAKDGASHFKWVRKESKSFKGQIKSLGRDGNQQRSVLSIFRKIMAPIFRISQRIFPKK